MKNMTWINMYHVFHISKGDITTCKGVKEGFPLEMDNCWKAEASRQLVA